MAKELADFKMRQESDMKDEQEKYRQQKRSLETERDAELLGKGADASAIRKQEEIISGIDNQLAIINNQRKTIIEYQKDKEELFDKEDSIKQEKKVLERKAESLQSQYEEKVRKGSLLLLLRI